MALAIGSLLVGSILGLVFDVLILVPAVLIAAILAVIDGWIQGLGISGIILTIAVSAVALEIGYLSGAGASMLILKSRIFRASDIAAPDHNCEGCYDPFVLCDTVTARRTDKDRLAGLAQEQDAQSSIQIHAKASKARSAWSRHLA